MRPHRVALLFLFGAVVLSTMDGFHTHSGATMYPHPVLLKAAWWVPLLFGCTAGFGGLAFTLLFIRLGGRAREHSPLEVTGAVIGFGALYFASGFLPLGNGWMTLVLLAGAGVLWAWMDRTWQSVVLALGTALCGCATEITLTRIGAFSHLRADFWGIPMWLPALYIASVPAIGHVARLALRVPAGEASQRVRAGVAVEC